MEDSRSFWVRVRLVLWALSCQSCWQGFGILSAVKMFHFAPRGTPGTVPFYRPPLWRCPWVTGFQTHWCPPTCTAHTVQITKFQPSRQLSSACFLSSVWQIKVAEAKRVCFCWLSANILGLKSLVWGVARVCFLPLFVRTLTLSECRLYRTGQGNSLNSSHFSFLASFSLPNCLTYWNGTNVFLYHVDVESGALPSL